MIHVHQAAEHLFHARDVVAVDGAEVLKAQGGEKLIPDKGVANAVFDLLKSVVQPFPHARDPAQGFRHVLLHAQPPAADSQARQLLRERAHVAGNGHAVVVEHHHERRVQTARVVQRFVAHAAGQRAVAHHSHDPVLFSPHIPRPRHAQGGGNGGGRVARVERVVFAFLPAGKAAQPVQLPQGGKVPASAGEQLMGVALVAHIENQLILRAVKHPMQRNGQLHRPQIGGQVPAVYRHGADDFFPDVLCQCFQFLFRQRFQLGRGLNIRELHSNSPNHRNDTQ